MSQEDQTRWNARYTNAAFEEDVNGVLLAAGPWLPRDGRALDVAGGLGRHAFHLAARGLQVTLLDVSDHAVQRVQQRAALLGMPVHSLGFDADHDPLPAGPFDVVVCTYFLNRPLLKGVGDVLKQGGLFVASQHTVKNLERQAHPSRRFLLKEDEFPTLLPPGFTVLLHRQHWTVPGTHEAWLIARKG